MRRRSAAWLAAVLALGAGVPEAADAAITIELVWTSTTGGGISGSSSIAAAPGDQLVGEIRITPDTGGVLAYAVSLEFDTDLDDELDLVGFTEALPAAMETNISPGIGLAQDSTPSAKGRALTFEAVCGNCNGPTSGTFVAGTVTFDVTGNVASDGHDVFTGTFNVVSDGVGNNAFQIVTPVFLNASVNQAGIDVPIVSTPGVLATSLVILLGVWMVSRRRSLSR